MKRVEFTITIECRDDVPAHVVQWMADNLEEHAAHEFDCDYESRFTEPEYEGPPVDGDIVVRVGTVR